MNEPKKKLTFREQVQGRTFRAGSYTVALAIVAIAVAVVINILVGRLPSSYTVLDMTQQELYTLSDQTQQILKNLDTDVTVYLLAETGSEDTYLSNLLEQYQARSSHIKVVTKDPVLYPSFSAQYTAEELSENSLIVESALRSDVVPYEEIYLYTYSSYYYYSYVSDVQFAGESALTTAIDYVTTRTLPTIYCLTGHGETQVGEALAQAIAGDNMALADLNLLAEEAVPEDAGCVLIHTPTADLSVEEADLLKAYLEVGGRLLCVTDYSLIPGQPNLQDVMAAYGLGVTSGLIIEGNASYCYRYRNYLLPQVLDTPITSALYEGRYMVFAPNAHGVGSLNLYRSSVTVTPLLTTSADAYAKADINNAATLEKEDGDMNGPFYPAVAAQEEHDGVETRLVWLGTPMLLDESANALVSGANNDLVLAALGWMTGSDSSIAIHTKTLTTEYLTVPDSAASLWSALFIGVIPALLLICGGIVLVRRRKR